MLDNDRLLADLAILAATAGLLIFSLNGFALNHIDKTDLATEQQYDCRNASDFSSGKLLPHS